MGLVHWSTKYRRNLKICSRAQTEWILGTQEWFLCMMQDVWISCAEKLAGPLTLIGVSFKWSLQHNTSCCCEGKSMRWVPEEVLRITPIVDISSLRSWNSFPLVSPCPQTYIVPPGHSRKHTKMISVFIYVMTILQVKWENC